MSIVYNWKKKHLKNNNNIISQAKKQMLEHRVHILLWEGNPISLAFQNIDPPIPLSARRVCVSPAFVAGEDRLAGRRGGWGGQYFGRREK